MGLHTIFLSFLMCYHLFFGGWVECNWNLSKDKDLDIERQLRQINKPAKITIVNKYGDIYDCVDFNIQPAFDHQLLRNRSNDFQIKTCELHNKINEENSSIAVSFSKESEVEICPVGMVPIRRITKGDLIREKQMFKTRQMNLSNPPRTYLAIARTKNGRGRYAGAESYISLHNPKANGQQYTAARIKIQRGSDSIEAGWRVDPTLYRDNRTRFFVRTDAGSSHCYNTRCPGYVHKSRVFNVDHAFSSFSKPGGEMVHFPVRIRRDNNGNWNLFVGDFFIFLGYWPARIFSGLGDLADYIDWGGAAYAPPGIPLPRMGSGNFIVGRTDFDAYMARMKIINEKGKTVDAVHIEEYASDSSLYQVIITNSSGGFWKRLILYGGPGQKKAK